MPARERELIRMNAAELEAFLASESTMTIATIGPQGRPHLMPVHYYLERDGRPATWTYAKSQKTRNLERDPRATLQVEAGQEYGELRGAMLEADVEIVRDLDVVAQMGWQVVTHSGRQSSGTVDLGGDARARVLAQAPKRVGLRFTITRALTWDHRKLSPRAAQTGQAAPR
ncbi:MAG: pyridoxamine 5'-phosphate oxidase family protein [Candidatus Dormibacter sp.]|uniref:pyridoxamine 5'-phosphate oxidase family protein n=1 Tax=Candidatus Dormibacter sp. TaxID=2973982 RepID=UPI000DB4C425|nr:MAG: pyridoxamine 5'-phosphate oxidase [Candidatus Dormibacteraeota bacterium]